MIEHGLAIKDGSRIGKYRVISQIGSGGSSIIYKVKSSTGQVLALKELIPFEGAGKREGSKIIPYTQSGAKDFDDLKGILLNAGRLIRAIKHNNILNTYEVFEENNTLYMVMDLVDGRSLDNYINNQIFEGDEADFHSLFKGLLSGVKEIHSMSVIHRDIKPANLIRKDNGEIILIDFGSISTLDRGVYREGEKRVNTGVVTLTDHYAAIEQYDTSRELKQGSFTDIYALAATMYYVLFGKKPPTSEERKRSNNSSVLVKERNGFSSQFIKGLNKGLSIDASDRPKSIIEWIGDLGWDKLEAENSKPIVAINTDETSCDKGKIDLTSSVKSKNKLLASIILLFISIGVIWLWKYSSEPSPPSPSPPLDVTTLKEKDLIDSAKKALSRDEWIEAEYYCEKLAEMTPSHPDIELLNQEIKIQKAKYTQEQQNQLLSESRQKRLEKVNLLNKEIEEHIKNKDLKEARVLLAQLIDLGGTDVANTYINRFRKYDSSKKKDIGNVFTGAACETWPVIHRSNILKSVQAKLNEFGYYSDLIDGKTGSNTHKAIVHYQLVNGLEITGAINDEFLMKMGVKLVTGKLQVSSNSSDDPIKLNVFDVEASQYIKVKNGDTIRSGAYKLSVFLGDSDYWEELVYILPNQEKAFVPNWVKVPPLAIALIENCEKEGRKVDLHKMIKLSVQELNKDVSDFDKVTTPKTDLKLTNLTDNKEWISRKSRTYAKLVIITESMNDKEKREWLAMYRTMTDKQRDKLIEILQIEQIKLANLEMLYQEEIEARGKISIPSSNSLVETIIKAIINTYTLQGRWTEKPVITNQDKALFLRKLCLDYPKTGSFWYLYSMYSNNDKERLDCNLANLRISKPGELYYLDSLNSAAWILSTSNNSKLINGKMAIELAEKMLKINIEPWHLDTVAACFAEAGDFTKAISFQEEALEKVHDKDKPEFRRHLASFKAFKPWREDSVEPASTPSIKPPKAIIVE